MNAQRLDVLLQRITVVTGHYGSGKTELAINLARYLKRSGKQVALADLDVINPYFRSREIHHQFKEEGITLIAPKGQWANADLPIVSGEIYKYISDPSFHLILDVGGDKDGAIATAQYAAELKPFSPDVLFVVNTNRPYVSSVSAIIETAYSIEDTLHLKMTGLVNNTNLGSQTKWSDIIEGWAIAYKASKEMGVPFRFSCVVPELMEEVTEHTPDHPWFWLERNMKLPWEISLSS